MNKKKIVEKHKKSRQPKAEITAAEHRANANLAVNLLMPIIEKMMANPADIQPVAENLDDLLFEMRNGIKRQPFIVQAAGGRRLAVCDDVVTEFEYQPSGDAEVISAITKDITFTDAATTTLTDTKTDTFTEAEKLILEQLTLEQIQNG